MSESIRIEGITRRMGARALVDDVSLTLAPGETTALLGPSGAGKTTLLRLIAGFERADAGRIIAGKETFNAPGQHVPPEKRRIGLVFQDFALLPHMTARANVAFGLAHLPRDEARRIAEDWLARLGLAERASAYPSELSGGEQQRVAIARALASEPRAILMDEPFSGLDPSLRESVRERAFEAIRAAGVPTLIVTHDPAEALAVAERLAIMVSGRLIQQGQTADIYARPASLAAARALGPLNDITLTPELSSALGFARETQRIFVRPEGVCVDAIIGSSAPAEVVSQHGAGPLSQTVLRWAGQTIRAKGLAARFRTGETVAIRLDPALTFIFPSGET
jgi:iron(III) transport system ATP-binding protein